MSVKNYFFWTKGHKDKRGYGNGLVEINLMFFCSYVLKQWKFVCCELFF